MNNQSIFIAGRRTEVLRGAGEDGLAALSTTQKLVSLTKTRYQQHVDGVDVEQTDITVSVDSREHSRWRSISFESSDLKSVTKLLRKTIPGDTEQLEDRLLSSGTLPRGYPQFVLDILSST